MNIIGSNLQKARKSLKLNQKKFAEPLGVSGGQISLIELGKSGISEAILRLLELTYQINTNWLKTGEGEMFLDKPVSHSDPAVESLIDQKAQNNTDLSALSDAEKRIIKMFRKLDPERKQRIIDNITDAFIMAQEDK